MLEELMAI